MTTPQLEEDGILREWAPLSRLLQQIPLKTRRGLFMEDVKLTCVDAVSECIAVGASPGIIYWYNRSSHAVVQLTPEKNAHSITCIKLVSTVDIMVAAGDDNGIVTIFKVPKPTPDWLPHYKKETIDKSIERYTIGGLHSGRITTLEWSLNGQKLFSGDSAGQVIYTEIDFYMNLSKAREILNENYSVVQLSYNQRTRALVVSTVLRCTICFNEQNSWRVVQVGQKERSSLLALGGVFYYTEGVPTIPLIYCCRPGLRLWQANTDGSVQQTILFKEAMKNCKNPIRLLRNIATKDNSDNSWQLCEFGRLVCWRDGLLVSHSADSVVIIDPIRVTVVATLRVSANHNICSLAATPNELFLICGARDLLRVSYTPDINDSIGSIGIVATGEAVSSIPRFTPSPVTGTVLDMNFKAPTSKLSASIPESVICASEVTYGRDTTLPPVVVLHDGVTELRVDQSRFIQLNAIGEEAFDEIIYVPDVKVKKKNGLTREQTSEEDYKSSTLRVDELDSGKQLLVNDINDSVESIKLENSIPADILPDFRSIESIVEDVKQKEILLEASLIYPENEGDLPRLELPKKGSPEKSPGLGESLSDKNITKDDERLNNVIEQTTSPKSDVEKELVEEDVEEPSPIEGTTTTNTEVPDTADLTHSECYSLEIKNEADLLTSDDNDSTQVWHCMADSGTREELDRSIELVIDDAENEISDYFIIKETSPVDGAKDNCADNQFIPHPVEFTKFGDWIELFAPDKVTSVSVNKERIVICCPKLNVYSVVASFGKLDRWQRLDYKAQQFLISYEADIACRIHCGIAQYSNNWGVSSSWEVLCRDVQWASIDSNDMWYVTRGELFHMPNGSNISRAIPCDKPISQVSARQGVVLVITNAGQVMSLEKGQWRLIGCRQQTVKHLAIGPMNLVWLVDKDNALYVTDNVSAPPPLWWQVVVKNGETLEVASICTTEEGLFVTNSLRDSILINTNSVLGYRWEVCDLDINCLQFTAEGVIEDKGSLWILAAGNQLYCGGPLPSSVLQAVSAPLNNIVCVASAPGTLWVLSDEGRVYIRHGITDANPCGTQWWKLNLEQISEKVQFSHISCGCDVVWACDIRGKILMMVGAPQTVSSCEFVPVWVTVEGSPRANNTFTKIFVGPQSYMVWALDNAGNVYVREAIFPDFLVGTGWVHVDGIKASHLSISGEAVWALSKTGVFKRIGISECNYIGESWLFISGNLDHISASVNDCVWGVCGETGRLVVFKDRIFPVSSQALAENDWTLI